MIDNEALALSNEFTPGKIEYEAVWVLQPPHIRLDESAELYFDINTVGALRNLDTCKHRVVAQHTNWVFSRNNRGSR